MRLHTILRPRGAGVRFLEVVVTLAIREFEQRRPKLMSRERRKIDSWTCMYLSMKASRVVLRGVIRNSLKYCRYTTLNIPKCELFTLHLSCKRDPDKIRNYMDRRVTPPRRATSPWVSYRTKFKILQGNCKTTNGECINCKTVDYMSRMALEKDDFRRFSSR